MQSSSNTGDRSAEHDPSGLIVLPKRRRRLGTRIQIAFSNGVSNMFAAGGPAFRSLAVSHSASSAGDVLVAFGLANTLFFSVPSTEARSNVVLYLVLTMAPFALIGPLLGMIFDRPASERFVLTVSSLVRVVVAVGLAFTLVDPTLKWWLFGLSFLVLVLSRVHGIARSALLPQALTNALALVTANAKIAQTGVIGTALAVPLGIGLARWDPRATLFAAAAVFCIAAWESFMLPREALAPYRNDDTTDEPNGEKTLPSLSPDPLTHGPWAPNAPTSETDVATVTTAEDPVRPTLNPALRLARVATTVVRFLNGFLILLLAFAFRDVDAPLMDFGAMLGSTGVGYGVAAMIAPRLERRLREEPMVVAALAVEAAAAFVAGQFFSLPSAAVLALVAGYSWGTAKFAFDGLLQATVLPEKRGRAFTSSETVFQVAWVAGALAPTAAVIDVRIGLLFGGILALFAQTIYVSRLLQRI